jgi:hypothetical protein
MSKSIQKTLVSFSLLLFVLPSSTTYEMHDVGFGAGGSGISDSTSYSSIGIVGEQGSSEKNIGTTYNLGPGLIFTQQANVPGAPAFTNPSSYYNKLQFILDTGSNPSDTLYAIAISTDDFVTTNYVQADNTIGSSAVYQTYAVWGGGSGANVIGLVPGTTYKMRVKAVHTKYTETEYSATATAATVNPTLTYDIDVASTDTESASPYIVAFGTLSVGSVSTATNRIWVDIDSNAENGAQVYAYDTSGGLVSANASNTITSATADLSAVPTGYGLQIATVTQSAGGPLAKVSPFNGASENVGGITTASQTIFTTTGAPITAGRASIYLKAKAATTTPAASDYADTIIMIASGSF